MLIIINIKESFHSNFLIWFENYWIFLKFIYQFLWLLNIDKIIIFFIYFIDLWLWKWSWQNFQTYLLYRYCYNFFLTLFIRALIVHFFTISCLVSFLFFGCNKCSQSCDMVDFFVFHPNIESILFLWNGHCTNPKYVQCCG